MIKVVKSQNNREKIITLDILHNDVYIQEKGNIYSS